MAGQDARSGRMGPGPTDGGTAGSSTAASAAYWGSSVAGVLDATHAGSGYGSPVALQVMPTEPRVSALAAWLPEQGYSPLSGSIAVSGSLALGVAAMTAPTAQAAGLGIERTNPTVCWWENDELADIGWAVEQVFLDPTPTGELVRPYIDQVVADQLWTGHGAVPPPTPVDGVTVRGIASAMPTRRQLRERRRVESSPRAVAARRVAQGGVLAVTVFGVVAANVPHFGSSLRSGLASAVHDLDPSSGRDAALAAGAADLAGSPVQAQPVAGGPDGRDVVAGLTVPAAATSASAPAAPAGPVGAAAAPAASPSPTVDEALRQKLIKDQADGQQVGGAAAGLGGGLPGIGKAQAAADAAAQAAAARRQDQISQASRDAVRDPRGLAQALVADRGWSAAQFTCLDKLWTRESNWNYQAYNPSSGAFGIPQALPGSKMGSVASDWRTNPATQIKWGLNYIADRYSTPCGAWAHSQAYNWY